MNKKGKVRYTICASALLLAIGMGQYFSKLQAVRILVPHYQGLIELGDAEAVATILERLPNKATQITVISDAPSLEESVRWCPLHCAVWHGHYEITKLLLDAGADPNTDILFPGRRKYEPGKNTFKEHGYTFTLEEFEPTPPGFIIPPPNWKVAEGEGPSAEEAGDAAMLFRRVSRECRRPLEWAVIRGDVRLVRLLISRGAKVQKDERELGIATMLQRTACLKVLEGQQGNSR